MANENLRTIQSLLGGLTQREIITLQKELELRVGRQTGKKGARLIGYENGYLEVKKFKRMKNGAEIEPYEYEYWRWWDGKSLRSKYVGVVGTYIKQQKPAQPKHDKAA